MDTIFYYVDMLMNILSDLSKHLIGVLYLLLCFHQIIAAFILMCIKKCTTYKFRYKNVFLYFFIRFHFPLALKAF